MYKIMSHNIKLILTIALFLRASVVSLDNGNLLSVITIYRHGARTPTSFYPNDPYYYNSTLFPEGYGQLTNEGKNEQYALGLWLSSRYDGWLPSAYNVSDIHVQSTNYDRTIMSAQCNLAGLYAPTGSQIWNSSVPNWQPVPIHTIPDEYDSILAAGAPCNRWLELRELVDTDPYFQSIYKQYDNLFTYLSNYSGGHVTSLSDIKELADTLYVEREQYNLSLPAWTTEVYPNPLNQLVGYHFVQDTFNVTMARLKVGRFYHKIFTHFENFAENFTDATEPKFLMFSAHETTLSNLLNAMNAFDLERPPYASALIFELRRNVTDSGSYLNIFYRKNGELRNVSANGCDLECELEDFGERMKEVIVNEIDWTLECNDSDNYLGGESDEFLYDYVS